MTLRTDDVHSHVDRAVRMFIQKPLKRYCNNYFTSIKYAMCLNWFLRVRFAPIATIDRMIHVSDKHRSKPTP